MTTVVYVEPELVIALDKKVIFVNPNDLQIFKDVELPEDLTKCGLKATSGDKQEEEPAQKKSPTDVPSIQHVALSPDHQLLAVSTAGGQKAVLLYQCRPEHAKLLSVRPLSRTSSGLTFSSDSKQLLVTDKTGDCYQYDCVDQQVAPRLLLGHLSIVYDVLWTADTKFIITCDRDDKIRVTNYPNTYDIHGYCLGHKEFVAGLALLEDSDLVSVSGDKTLRIWDYRSGKELRSFELPAPALRLSLRKLGEHKYQAAVQLHQPEENVGIYELEKADDGAWQVAQSALLSFPDLLVGNVCFAQERLYVVGIAEERLVLRVADLPNSPPAPENWLGMVEEQFQKQCWTPDDADAWFKKRFDNVSEYLERKKRRLEEKQK